MTPEERAIDAAIKLRQPRWALDTTWRTVTLSPYGICDLCGFKGTEEMLEVTFSNPRYPNQKSTCLVCSDPVKCANTVQVADLQRAVRSYDDEEDDDDGP